MKQRNASPHTISSYRDTFRLLLMFTQQRLHKSPSCLDFAEIDAPLIAEFLEDLEKSRNISPRSRNLRLAAIRSFFRYAAFEAPDQDQSAQIQRVLAIPGKRCTRSILTFLVKAEIEALLSAPDQRTWSGRRDRALLLVAVQTGLRLSELTGLQWPSVVLQGTGAHIRVIGKGRKERCTPLTKQTTGVLKAWKREASKGGAKTVFPNARGGQLSADGLQYILAKHVAVAQQHKSLLQQACHKPHTLRHTLAMELMQSGVDRAMIAPRICRNHSNISTCKSRIEGGNLVEDVHARDKAGTVSPRRSAVGLSFRIVNLPLLCRAI